MPKANDLGVCPFCYGGLAVGTDNGSLLHTLPVCERYTALDPIAFLAAVRRTIEGRRKN